MGKKTLFDFEMVDGDPTVEDVRYLERFNGYNESCPLQFDESYIKLYNSIFDYRSILRSGNIPSLYVDKKYVKKSIDLWEKLGIHLSEIDVLDKAFDLDSFDGIITQEFLDSLYSVHPSLLPIVFKKMKSPEARVSNIKLESVNDSENNGVIYSEIVLPILTSKLTSCFYAHEIAHTQLSQVGGATYNILNTETIPMVMEQLFANALDSTGNTLTRLRNFRLFEFVDTMYKYMTTKNIAYSCRIEFDTYIQSTFQAIKLANTYFFGNTGVQKEMTNYINNIFSGKMSIEDMLTHFDAHLEDVPKDIKTLTKVPRQ